MITAVAAVAIVGVVSVIKKRNNKTQSPLEAVAVSAKPILQGELAPQEIKVVEKESAKPLSAKPGSFPKIDRMHLLFSTGNPKLPIVETVSYSSTVPWLKGRPAWISDYAAYYATSRHFIARSLHAKPDYFNQTVSTGRKFNVFRKDRNIEFHMLIDLSLCKMCLYYYDLETKERVLLKTYNVCLGRLDSSKPSGCLTPSGTYTLGDKIAIYTPGTTGIFQDQKTEMMRIFGTRWIPFGQGLEGATEPAKGYGIQGSPWIVDTQTGSLIENKECLGKYESDGCIRLSTEDMEELFAVVITKPSFVHLVKDFSLASLPGIEVATPSR